MSYRHRSNVGSVLATFPGAPVHEPPKHLDEPKEGEMGFRSGKKKGELEEGWNPNAKGGPKFEYHSNDEWLNLRLRAMPLPDTTAAQKQYDEDFPPLSKPKPSPTPEERQKKTAEQREYDKNFPPLPGSKPTPPKPLEFPEDSPWGKDKHKGPPPVVEPPRTTPMTKVQSGKSSVSVLNDKWVGGAKARLKIEREATKTMRSGLTGNVNKRKGAAKEGVKKNSDMAKSLAGLLGKFPQLVEKDGLLSRIVGNVEGQGQHDPKVLVLGQDGKPIPVMDPEDPSKQQIGNNGKPVFKKVEDPHLVEHAVDRVTMAADRLGKGKGEGDDANIVMQFIGCFVDGLTEVTEGKDKAKAQFDQVWPEFAKAFGLKDGDKDKLLDRVKGYKEIAGGAADTLSGKGARKADTRGTNDDKQVRMPNDPRLKIDDENALIKNDISGSMHSCLLAQELADSLVGGTGIKGEGDSVLVRDKDLINARALDALALTAGGMPEDSAEDFVMHTAFEMINGMQAITGLPPVSQVLATEIMDRMKGGQSFTDAVEPFFDDEDLPWKA